MKIAKGIILAGGTGSRLYPLTLASNKQLLPIYDKPAIYYPLTTLMLAGIRNILLISSPKDLSALQNLLGSGEQWGMQFSYQKQEEPRGLPDAFLVGEKFIANDPVALILGDNFFHGHGLSELVEEATHLPSGAHIFIYPVEDPSRYGVPIFNSEGRLLDLVEKPAKPPSRYAVTGLYYFDGNVSEYAHALKPSARGELEITDLIRFYLQEKRVNTTTLGRGYVWFDVGTPHSLLTASQYVEVIQSRQGMRIACPEEVAWRMNFISRMAFEKLLETLPQSAYKQGLMELLQE